MILNFQEVLSKHDSVIWTDSSGHITSPNFRESLDLTKETGLRIRFLQLNFTCLTDKRTLAWFGNPHDFDKLGTVEANFILFRQSLITRLIMKAWLTCALDASCIAPPGSHRSKKQPCQKTCLCHRFDQAALGAILTFFYGHPEDRVNHLPAYAIRNSEDWFHIKRG